LNNFSSIGSNTTNQSPCTPPCREHYDGSKTMTKNMTKGCMIPRDITIINETKETNQNITNNLTKGMDNKNINPS